MKISLGGIQKPKSEIGSGKKNLNQTNSVLPSKRLNLFGEDEDDRTFAPAKTSSSTNQLYSKSHAGSSNLISGTTPSSKASRAREEAALSIDSSIFDYDGVYDSMKEGQRVARSKNEEENKKRDPKYMSASFAASEQRRIDRQRAEARKIQREREEEGEMYENTEKFVTEAYKQQMEEMRKAEKEEEMKEKRTAQKNQGAASFYKDMLNDQNRAHQAAVEASIKATSHQNTASEQENDDEESRKIDRIEEARSKGLDVQTNDENEVIDERSLLSAGLNTFSSQKKRKKISSNSDRRDEGEYDDQSQSDTLSHNHKIPHIQNPRQAQRQRQSRMIEEQMLALEQEREKELQKQEAEKKAAIIGQKRNDHDRIEMARQRALERRKNKQE